MKEKGIIETGILYALADSPVYSKQRLQAESLKVIYDALVADGFRDPRLLDVRDEILEQETEVIHHGAFSYFPLESYFEFTKNGQKVAWSEKENKTFYSLAKNMGKVIDTKTLCRPWGGKSVGENEAVVSSNARNSLKACIERMRRKLEPQARKGSFQYLIYVNGQGYMLVDPSRSNNNSHSN